MLRDKLRQFCSALLFATAALLFFSSSTLIAAEGLTFTVGVDTTCPYGIVNCWPEVREPIEGLHGVKAVSSRVDPKTLTCEVQMEKGLLLDAKALNAKVRREAGDFFSIRGVEAALSGSLVRRENQLALQMNGTSNLVFLRPLRQKVQKDPTTKVPVPPTDGETTAFERLAGRWNDRASAVRITGPLVLIDGNQTILEVRQFEWMNETAPARKE